MAFLVTETFIPYYECLTITFEQERIEGKTNKTGESMQFNKFVSTMFTNSKYFIKKLIQFISKIILAK